MKVLGIFVAVGVCNGDEYECDQDPLNNLISGYCSKKESSLKTFENYKLAAERYQDQEENYNKLAQCYNKMVDIGNTARRGASC